jgi:hypothetical protein
VRYLHHAHLGHLQHSGNATNGTNAYEQSNTAGGPKGLNWRERTSRTDVVARKPCDLGSALKSRWHGSRKGGSNSGGSREPSIGEVTDIERTKGQVTVRSGDGSKAKIVLPRGTKLTQCAPPFPARDAARSGRRS